MEMKNTAFYFACLLMMTGCGRDEYNGEVIEDDLQEYVPEPMPVKMNIGAGNFLTQTKGSGPLENLGDGSPVDTAVWNKARFYVYAFAEGEETDMRITWDSPENEGESHCLIDATRKDDDSFVLTANTFGGKETCISDLDYRSLLWSDDQLVYYNLDDYSKAYEFFAYYVDDYSLTDDKIHRESDHIDIDVEIDGKRDLMGARAELTEEQEQYINSKQGDLATRLMESRYSTFAANYEIDPCFVFSHYLCKVRVELYPGGNLSEKGPESPCYQQAIRVRALSRNKAVMTVATRDEEMWPLGARFDENQSLRSFDLTYKILNSEGELRDVISEGQLEYLESDVQIDDVYQRTPYRMPGYLLVAPDELLQLVVKASNEDEEIPVELKAPGGAAQFEPGKAYVVRLAVYGRQQIAATVDVEPWVPGGEIIITPDLQ